MYSEENFDPRVIFYNEIWLQLQNQNNYEVVIEVINYMTITNLNYQINGGNYPTVEYVIGYANDVVNGRKKEIKSEEIESEEEEQELTQKEKMDQVRNSWLKKFKIV